MCLKWGFSHSLYFWSIIFLLFGFWFFFTTFFYSFTSQPAITVCTNDALLADAEEKCYCDTFKHIAELFFKIYGVELFPDCQFISQSIYFRIFYEISFMKEIYHFLWSKGFSIDWCVNWIAFSQFHCVPFEFNYQWNNEAYFYLPLKMLSF